MRRISLFHVAVLVLAVAVLSDSVFCQDKARTLPALPVINFPLPGGKLNAAQMKGINDAIDARFQVISRATNEDDVIVVRDDLLKGYHKYKNVTYEIYFANKCNNAFETMMTGKVIPLGDALRRVKRINSSKLLVAMQRSELVPCYAKMVVDQNQAVRYLGWKALFGLRELILKGRCKGITQASFVTLVADALAKENNSIVLRPVIAIADFGRQENDAVRSQFTKEISAKLFQGLEASAPYWRRLIVSASEQDAWQLDALSGLNMVAASLTKSFTGDKKAKARGLQYILDLAGSAATAYAAKCDDKASRAANANLEVALSEKVLLLAENNLNALVGKTNKLIESALKEKVATGAAVQLAVLVKWTSELKSAGVVRPGPPPEEKKPEPKPEVKLEPKPVAPVAKPPAKPAPKPAPKPAV